MLTLVPTETRLERLHNVALEANRGHRSGFLAFGLLDDFTTCTAERFIERSIRPLGATLSERVAALTETKLARAA